MHTIVYAHQLTQMFNRLILCSLLSMPDTIATISIHPIYCRFYKGAVNYSFPVFRSHWLLFFHVITWTPASVTHSHRMIPDHGINASAWLRVFWVMEKGCDASHSLSSSCRQFRNGNWLKISQTSVLIRVISMLCIFFSLATITWISISVKNNLIFSYIDS